MKVRRPLSAILNSRATITITGSARSAPSLRTPTKKVSARRSPNASEPADGSTPDAHHGRYGHGLHRSGRDVRDGFDGRHADEAPLYAAPIDAGHGARFDARHANGSRLHVRHVRHRGQSGSQET